MKLSIINYQLSIIIIFILLSTSSFAQDFSKLSFAEIDSLMYVKEAVEDLEACIHYMQGGRAKAKAAFGEQDSTFADYTAILGCFYQRLGQYKEAEQLLIQAKDIQAKVMGKKHPSYAASLNYLGGLYCETIQYDKSEAVLIEAKQIFENFLSEEHPFFSENLSRLGELYEDMGSYEKAETIYTQACQVLKKVRGTNNPFFAKILGRLAYVYTMIGRYEKAEALLLQTKDIFIKISDDESIEFGVVLNNLAGLYQMVGSFDKVEPLYLQASNIAIKEFGENSPHILPSFNNLARFYQNIGQYEKAEVLYLKVMDITAANNMIQHPSGATIFNNFAGLYRLMRKYKEAEALYLKGLDVRAKTLGKEHPSYANSLSSLGVFYKEMGQFEKAEQFFLQAKNIELKTLGKENPDYARVLSNLANTYLEMGRLDTALQYCYQSIDANSAEIDSSFKDWTNLDKHNYYSTKGINNCLTILLQILKAQYQKTKDKTILETHYAIAKAAMRLNEQIRNDFSGEGDKLRTLQSNTFFVKEGIQGALALETMARKNVHIQEAFSFAELNKSILLADAVKGNRARALGDFPDTLVAQEITLQTELTNLKKQQYEAKTPEEKLQNGKDLVALNLKMDAFIKSIKDKYPKYHALKYENITAKVSDIQALLDNKTALLEYFLTDSVAYLFVVTKTNLELYPLPITLEKIKTQIRTLRNTLSNYSFVVKEETKNYNQYSETAYWFYENLIAPALKSSAIKNLILVTDGELGHIPFEVFLLEQAPQKPTYKNLHYLVKDYNISYNYSATLFVESQRGKNGNARKNNGKILACAASYSQKDSALVNLREPYFTNLRKLLNPLPAAQAEIAALSENFQGDFLWNDSTNERFFKENAQAYGIIHLAMHGILEQKQPMLSSLAFTENKDSVEDNFLQAFEIARLKLNADLVVLSACETGYGKFQQGEGVVSLARSFMYAGVPSLVVSLWQVNDHSTAEIMKLFYQNLADGMTKDAALRQAKLDYLDSAEGIAAHPAFWSPFIQLGDSRAVYLKTKTGWFWWLVGGAVLALGGGVFAMRRQK